MAFIQFLAAVQDEDTVGVEYDIIRAFLIPNQIRRSTLGNEQKSFKLKPTLHAEMFAG